MLTCLCFDNILDKEYLILEEEDLAFSPPSNQPLWHINISHTLDILKGKGIMKIVSLLLIVIFLVSGCGIPLVGPTDISDIKGKSQKYDGEQVSIKGKVVETVRIPLISKGMFRVDDGTGRIWVVSQERMPFRGDKVKVKGRVNSGFKIAGKTYGTVIIEGEDK